MGAALGAGLGVLLGIVGRGLQTHASTQLQQNYMNQQFEFERKKAELQNQYAFVTNMMTQNPQYFTPEVSKKFGKLFGEGGDQLLASIGQTATAGMQHLAQYKGGAAAMPGFPGGGPQSVGAAASLNATGNRAGLSPAAPGGGAAPASAPPIQRISQIQVRYQQAQGQADAARQKLNQFYADPLYNPNNKMWQTTEKQLISEKNDAEKKEDNLFRQYEAEQNFQQTREQTAANEAENRAMRMQIFQMSQASAEANRVVAGMFRTMSDQERRDAMTNAQTNVLMNGANALVEKINDPKFDQKTRQAWADQHNKQVDSIVASNARKGIIIDNPDLYKFHVDPETKGWNLGPFGTTAGTPGSVSMGAPSAETPPPEKTAAPTKIPPGAPTATNHKTGKKMYYDGSKWVPAP